MTSSVPLDENFGVLENSRPNSSR